MQQPKVGLPVILATVAAVIVVVAALIMLGSPARAREHRLDEIRVQDLSSIASAIDRYWTKHSALPDTIDSLVSTGVLDRIPVDPSTGVRYPIHLTGGHSFRLCATFAQPTDTTDSRRSYDDWTELVRGRRSWKHGAGESCFDLNVERTDGPAKNVDKLDDITVVPSTRP